MTYSSGVWAVFNTQRKEVMADCVGATRRQALARFLQTKGCYILSEMTDDQIEEQWAWYSARMSIICTTGTLIVNID